MAYYGFYDVYSDHYQHGTKEMTGWQSLLIYLNSKLRWNCHYDPTTFIKKYMKGMFHDAADTMYKVFNEQLNYYVNLRAHAKEPHRPNTDITGGADDYPYLVLEGWINMFNQAIEEVKHYQDTNPDLYETIKTRIQIEMSIEVYKVLSIYGGTGRPFNLAKLNEYKGILLELSEKSPGLTLRGNNIKDFIGA
jgi:hypothetical protein